jgi:hypothetical protein
VIPVSYILPIRSERLPQAEFVDYVNGLTRLVAEVLLVDGSAPVVYAALDAQCVAAVRHLQPDVDLASMRNGKVRGVITGLRRASYEAVIVADDDVRYTGDGLAEMVAALDTADIVRPQNYFDPLPWHARLDTARALINRTTGGDWPGTLGLRRSTLLRSGGYDGNVLFENLELVRTTEAVGGRARCLQSLFVRRLPPTASHFWRQRIRQAYDEFARPARLLGAMALLPLLIGLALRRDWLAMGVAFGVVPVLVAEAGRRRANGRRVFRGAASLWAPAWVFERALCAWAAVGARVALGGIPYSGGIVRRAATPPRHLRDAVRRATLPSRH